MYGFGAGRVSIVIGALLLAFAVHAQDVFARVADGRTVGIEYSLTLEDGLVVQSSAPGTALVYLHGRNQILPALEQALRGLFIGEERAIELRSGDAYGEVNPDAFQEVALEQIPERARLAGAQLSAEGFDGPILVEEVRKETVLLNFNHPLAGQTVIFNIKVISIE